MTYDILNRSYDFQVNLFVTIPQSEQIKNSLINEGPDRLNNGLLSLIKLGRVGNIKQVDIIVYGNWGTLPVVECICSRGESDLLGIVLLIFHKIWQV